MAQIKIPAEFAQQVSLLSIIYEKHTALGAESPLTAWLAEQKIDLAADVQAGKNATAEEKRRAQQDALSKTAFETRDAKFDNVITFLRPAAQALKNFYKPNYAMLADWGLPVTENGRMTYPSSFEEINDVAAQFFTKLASYEESKSPLAVYIKVNKVNVAGLTEDNTSAASENTAADKAAKAAENATEKRNLFWKDALTHIHAIADYLKSVYPTNPRELGEWGYKVDESDRKPKLRKSKLGLNALRTVTGVALNSILINTGKVTIIVYKGKGIAGTSITLKPGDKMGILKGYSTITVQNTSTLETAEYTIEIQE